MLEWAMSHPSFKTQLFRFVDVFPATTDDADVLRHLEEYFEGADVPKAARPRPRRWPSTCPFGKAAAASVARRNIARMAEQFIVGTDADERGRGAAPAVARGERVHRRPARREDGHRERGRPLRGAGRRARSTSCSRRRRTGRPTITSSATTSGPLPAGQRERQADRAGAARTRRSPATTGSRRPRRGCARSCGGAARGGAFVYFDMEHYDVKDLTLQLFRELLDEPELADARRRRRHPGLPEGLARRPRRPDRLVVAVAPCPITVRLVKGAYWDTETVVAGPRAGPCRCSSTRPRPTPTSSGACACCTTTTARCGPRSAATTCARSPTRSPTPRRRGIPDTGYEIQMLYGMAEPIHAAIRRLGLRLRVYAPVGELVPGMAYLVRRLLENTSNESFVRRRSPRDATSTSCSPRRSVTVAARARRRAARAPTDARDPRRTSPSRPRVAARQRATGLCVGRRERRPRGSGATCRP